MKDSIANHTAELAKVNAEETRYLLVHIHGIDGALPGLLFACDQLFREGAATGRPAGPAVGVWQHLLDLVDARVLVDEQAPAGDGQDTGEQQPQDEHEHHGDRGTAESCFHVVTGLLLTFPVPAGDAGDRNAPVKPEQSVAG